MLFKKVNRQKVSRERERASIIALNSVCPHQQRVNPLIYPTMFCTFLAIAGLLLPLVIFSLASNIAEGKIEASTETACHNKLGRWVTVTMKDSGVPVNGWEGNTLHFQVRLLLSAPVLAKAALTFRRSCPDASSAPASPFWLSSSVYPG